mmetsp:Transcript_70671/g.117390  ORF Transcript_70671/g.117390 Transcript_70671/m.117390 type:complete len:386 (-) Transcript_70671:151-1308(-)|eukprot:CAMPEP_0119333852 /NCGR_PEP_ID=MMETSP1333-20130426/86122_1 /TAXON_ID=418940 /ORGANISM="Scyphosphaera apsteinii, Strain RCC1455" /LENGTH=385 /DNA_ID=CAMNT_0007344019 /DNA_START=218 /DNA_END=1375 /DNA_ORIENTATION=-
MTDPHPIDQLIEQLDMTSMINGVYDENRLQHDLHQLASEFTMDSLGPEAFNELSQPLGLVDVPPKGLDTLFGQPLIERSPSSASSSQSSAASDTERDASMRPRQNKMPWTREEDRIIEESVAAFGPKWSRIAEALPTLRTDDSVRNRWHRLQRKQQQQASRASSKSGSVSSSNRLSPPTVPMPDMPMPERSAAAEEKHDKHGDMWTAEEDRIIDEGVRLQGLKWRAIAAMLPGRTDSGCRNRWVRTQERLLAAQGRPVHGAAEVFAVLRELGQLQQPRPPTSARRGPKADQSGSSLGKSSTTSGVGGSITMGGIGGSSTDIKGYCGGGSTSSAHSAMGSSSGSKGAVDGSSQGADDTCEYISLELLEQHANEPHANEQHLNSGCN